MGVFDWLLHFPEALYLDTRSFIDAGIDHMLQHWDTFFQGVRQVLRLLLTGVGGVISLIPWWLLLLAVFTALLRMGRKWYQALLYTGLLFLIGIMGLWDLMNETLAIIIASVLISLLLGLPVGILISSSRRANAAARPFLDAMQTMPAFVYLIPAVMLLGLGNVPAVIATIIYAIPPVIRLTSLGIRQVDKDLVEAAQAFGSTRSQTLFKVQIPLAMPTIMTGVNQTIMMAISMVVTCAMIGATGLGAEVIKGINRLESGRGFVAGSAIVILAVVLDRLTQGLFQNKPAASSSL